MSPTRLKDKCVAITGGASGIGAEGVLLFAREGARVVAIDRDRDALDAVVRQAPPGSVKAVVADLADPEAACAALAEAARLLGRLDVFWGNAGVVGPAGIEDLTLADYANAEAINLRANVLMAGEAVRLMRAASGGAMLFTSSISGLVGSRKSPVYAVTKHALLGLTRSLAIAHGTHGIRVNAICPGITETPMLPHAMGRGLDTQAMEKNKADHLAAIPLGRAAEASEIARAALWLVSDEASYVTGVALPVDGGYTCG